MPRELDLSSNEGSFLLQATRETVRLDARPLDAFREPEISFGKAWGSAHVQLGKTRVLVNVSADVVQPQPDRKHDGIFAIVVELSSMASTAFEAGRQNELEVMLAHLLEQALRRSNAVDTESLCIVAGRYCWSVRADVHVLSFDGGVVDASCIAVIAALSHFRKPEVEVAGEDVTVHSFADRSPVPLSLLHHPLCITVSFFNGGETVLVDATWEEQQISEGEMVVTTNAQGELYQIAKLGGVPSDALLLLRCLEMAVEQAQMLDRKLSRALKRDMEARNPSTLLAELQADNRR